MKDFIQITIVIVLIVIGIYSLFGGLLYGINWMTEQGQQRYFNCLEKTETDTCNKVFYKYKLKDN